MTLTLRPLGLADEAQALAAHDELAADGFEFLLHHDGQPWDAYLAELDRVRRGDARADGWVPGELLVGEVDGEIVGRTSVRYELNDWLAEHGGHVGYGVRPGFRRRGYATGLLRRSLLLCRARGLDRVMVTCDPDNTGSAAVIERCGGVFERLSTPDDRTSAMRRYWVDLG